MPCDTKRFYQRADIKRQELAMDAGTGKER